MPLTVPGHRRTARRPGPGADVTRYQVAHPVPRRTVSGVADERTPSITLEPSAVRKVAELASSEGGSLALVVSVRSGGCSGFRYEMFFADPADAEYASFQRSEWAADGATVSVLVDDTSAELLSGASLRYEDRLQDAGFKIENPNAKRSCGCGQSFS